MRKIKKGRKEESVLFNDAFNTFYLQLYDVEHHSDTDREILLFLISKYMIAQAKDYVTPVEDHWLK